jgi:hypothetical protein
MVKLFDPDPGVLCGWLATALLLGAAAAVFAGEPPEKDRLAGPAAELEITFLG